MQSLHLHFIYANDIKNELQHSQIVTESLNTVYSKQLKIIVEEVPADTTDVIIIVLWNELSETLEQQIQAALKHHKTSKTKVLLFKKNAQVAVDLTDRQLLMKRIEKKETLELFLSSTLAEHDPILFDTSEEFELRFSEKLEYLISKRLGTPTTPISFRPQLGSTYLERPRLLELLPDSAGYVVWLEAPYGYGKSILAAQWAKQLEPNWRIIWLSVDDSDLQSLLTEYFDLAAPVLWPELIELLWQEETLLVLEDLKGDENLDELLQGELSKGIQGLILLASRSSVETKVLSQLKQNGQLIHLQAGQLAFTETESQQLFGQSDQASKVWEQTQGWSLLVHFAYLTDGLPGSGPLVEGIKKSLSEEAWNELLFLAAIPSLPENAANKFTKELANANFVQTLESAYRVHSLVSEGLIEHYQQELKSAAIAEANRLGLMQQAHLFEGINYGQGLIDILEDTTSALYYINPLDFLRWHDLAPEPTSTLRRHHVTIAQLSLGKFEDGLANLELLQDSDLSVSKKMVQFCAGVFRFSNAEKFQEAEKLLNYTKELLPEVSPVYKACFYNNQAQFFIQNAKSATSDKMDWVKKAEKSYLDGLKQIQLEPNHSLSNDYEVSIQINLSNLYRDNFLDVSKSVSLKETVLKRTDLTDYLICSCAFGLAIAYTLLAKHSKALEHLQFASEKTREPVWQYAIKTFNAYLEKDLDMFPKIFQETKSYLFRELILYYLQPFWLRSLRSISDYSTMLDLKKLLDINSHVNIELAYAEAATGQLDKANLLLAEALENDLSA